MATDLKRSDDWFQDTAPRVELVGEPVATILVDVAHHGLRAPEISFAAVAAGSWGTHDLAGRGGSLHLEHGALTLRWPVSHEQLLEAVTMMGTRNEGLALSLEDGSRFAAELANLRTVGAAASVRLHHWSWQAPTKPILWLGELRGRLPSLGNLVIAEATQDRRQTRQGFALFGRCAWYLVELDERREGSRYAVVLDDCGSTRTRSELVHDVLGMEFAFGCSLLVDHLVGVDAERKPVAAISIGHMPRRTDACRPPVPTFLADGGIWPPALFRAVATAFRDKDPNILTVGIAAYLDSVVDHLDGAYLKSQIGLEAFARRLIGKATPDVLVADLVEWKTWLDSLANEVEARLVDKERKEMVIGKLKSAAYAPSGEMVVRALAKFGVTLPADLVREIGKRNTTAHEFTMNRAGEVIDFDRDTRRLEMVQVLLATLIACHVGYRGALQGYDADEEGHRPSPGWWPVDPLTERDRYLAQRGI